MSNLICAEYDFWIWLAWIKPSDHSFFLGISVDCVCCTDAHKYGK